MNENIKQIIKKVFSVLRLEKQLDKLIYYKVYFQNRKSNKRFVKNNPDLRIPPDYYLYETYKLDYADYFSDGNTVAGEIFQWTNKYLKDFEHLQILDWGCGVSRVCRHLSRHFQNNSKIYGCDINPNMINWGINNLPEVNYDIIDYDPPTGYKENKFNLIYGISIFTHIEASKQKLWFDELHRILIKGGVLLFTTHGTNCFEKLSDREKETLRVQGSLTRTYPQNGHRLMATYNTEDNIKEMIDAKFEVLDFYENEEAIKRTGEQDLWIIRKI